VTARIRLVGVLALLSFVALPAADAFAQAAGAPATQATCSISWVGREAQLEEFMRTAKIVKLEDVPIGVTKPRRAVFEGGETRVRAAWKPLRPAYYKGFRESYKAEIAAYHLDRLLGMNMVPPVVERTVDREAGAMILWVENVTGWDIKNPAKGPEPGWSQQLIRMKMFDQLVANIDRNQGNLIHDADWHLFLIDHSRAFIEKKDLKGIASLGRVDRVLWDRMKALTAEELQSKLGEWVSKKEIEALLIRRDRMQQEIDKMIAARGEASVFF
jgi:hypothetical protein